MAEYSRIAKGDFISAGGGSSASAQFINLPFKPQTVELWNYNAYLRGAVSSNVLSAYWDSQMGQGFATILGYNSTPALVGDAIISGGISTYSAGTMLQYGSPIAISSITAAAPPVITTSAAHGLSVGQWVIFENLYQTSSTGMPQMSGIPFQVLSVPSSTTFTVNWVATGSNYTAISGGGLNAAAQVKVILYPGIYFPGVSVITAIAYGSTTTVTTTTPHSYVVGQEVGFRISPLWGPVQLNTLPNPLIPGSPVYGFVTSVTSPTVFVVNINSTGFTAFSNNIPVANVPGLTPPQVFAAGDVNTGGVRYSGGNLYPSPVYGAGGSTVGTPTINGPAISGAFVNNTSSGFVVGPGTGNILTTAYLLGTSGDVIYWRAESYDYASP